MGVLRDDFWGFGCPNDALLAKTMNQNIKQWIYFWRDSQFTSIIMRVISFLFKKRKCQTVSVEVRKSQHKYVIGSKGANLHEILAETGVSVEIPPLDSQSGTITLRGEQDKLGPALTKVYSKVCLLFRFSKLSFFPGHSIKLFPGSQIASSKATSYNVICTYDSFENDFEINHK